MLRDSEVDRRIDEANGESVYVGATGCSSCLVHLLCEEYVPARSGSQELNRWPETILHAVLELGVFRAAFRFVD